ncbi:MAG: tetratricopeptide repeat protein [Endomicrobia bacterium]|nr:tetratricopeptide repeat protein [Endomicrobiia bacterium]
MKSFFMSLLVLFAAASFVFASDAELEKALNLLNDGHTDQAIDILKAKLQKEPDSSDNYLAMGMIQLEKNNYAEAKDSLKKALQINKKIIAAHYMLAMIYEKEGDYAAAIDKWKKIAKYSKDGDLKLLAEKHIEQLKGESK